MKKTEREKKHFRLVGPWLTLEALDEKKRTYILTLLIYRLAHLFVIYIRVEHRVTFLVGKER